MEICKLEVGKIYVDFCEHDVSLVKCLSIVSNGYNLHVLKSTNPSYVNFIGVYIPFFDDNLIIPASPLMEALF